MMMGRRHSHHSGRVAASVEPTYIQTPYTRRLAAAFEPTNHEPPSGVGPVANLDRELARFLEPSAPLRSSSAFFFSLCFHPVDFRRERIVMLGKCKTTFGALFTSVLFSLRDYGLQASEDVNPIVLRVFEVSIALGIIAGMVLTLFSYYLWQFSIIFSPSSDTWVRNTLDYCGLLFQLGVVVFVATFVALMLALHMTFQDHEVEAILVPAFALLGVVYGFHLMAEVSSKETQLELVHAPLWVRGIVPLCFSTRRRRVKLRADAESRADYFRHRAFIPLEESV